MKINYRISDFIFLSILSLLMISAIILSVNSGYLLSINNYLGFVCWGITIILMFTRFRYRRYGLAILLIMGTFSIFKFGIWTVSMSFAVSNFQTPRLDPTIFLILVVYCLVNRRVINRVLLRAFRGTPEEQKLKEEKEVTFYTRKFQKCTKEELDEVFSNYKNYPWAAKQAIDNVARTGNVNDLPV